MGRSAEMWFDAQEQQEDEQQPDTLAEELWQLGCAMNQARLEEMSLVDRWNAIPAKERKELTKAFAKGFNEKCKL